MVYKIEDTIHRYAFHEYKDSRGRISFVLEITLLVYSVEQAIKYTVLNLEGKSVSVMKRIWLIKQVTYEQQTRRTKDKKDTFTVELELTRD